MNLETIKVADDEQRRVLQIFTILKQLLIGRVQILVLAFVFPGEKTAHPNVGKATASGSLGNSFLEGVSVAFLIDLGWSGLTQNLAESHEVLLRGATFGQRGALPAGDEFGDRDNRHQCLSDVTV